MSKCSIILLICAVGISACSTASTSTTSTPHSPRTYETFRSTAAVESPLGGVAVIFDSSPFDLTDVTGSIVHNTGETMATYGSVSITDADGFETINNPNGSQSRLITDGVTELGQNTIGNVNYEFVVFFNQSGSVAHPNDAIGMLGIITDAADVPSGGTATYTGGGGASVDTLSGFTRLEDGVSTVEVDFASGQVDVEISGLSVTAGATPLDTIEINGMTISGNEFAGGSVRVLNSGSEVDITGANTVTSARGHFFGFDTAAGIPDEVAGIVEHQGDDGRVTGRFIAD